MAFAQIFRIVWSTGPTHLGKRRGVIRKVTNQLGGKIRSCLHPRSSELLSPDWTKVFQCIKTVPV